MNAAAYLSAYWTAPEKVAILSEGRRYSYRELRSQIHEITQWLILHDVQPQDRYILIAENSLFWVASYLAVLGRGAVVVPLSPKASPDLIQEVISSVKPKGVLTGASCRVVIGRFVNQHLMELNEDEAFIKSSIDQDVAFDPMAISEPAGTLATILFTSGSTGKPRGVMISHGNIIANTESIISYLGLTGNSRMLVVLPFFYCFGTSLLHTHLRMGGSLVLENSFRLPDKVLSRINEFECTGFAGVPSHYQLILHHSSAGKMKFPSLQNLQQAGGRLEPEMQQKIQDLFQPGKLFVMYGQTEATARLSYLPPERLHDKLGSIGKGIPGVSLFLQRADGSSPALGDTAEIIAEGSNVAMGYWQDSEASARVFQNGRLHTGDIAYQDGDGFFYIVDRSSAFLKLGGVRVAPSEIESIILKFPGTIEAAVTGFADKLLGEAVRLHIVHAEAEKALANLQAYCKQRLPINQQPMDIRFLPSLPKTISGKIDHKMLSS